MGIVNNEDNMAKKLVKKVIKKIVKVVKKVKASAVDPVQHVYGSFRCGACSMTGLDKVTKAVCGVCNGTPEK